MLLKSNENTLVAMLLESQSSPSYSPSPEVAHVLWIYLRINEESQWDSHSSLSVIKNITTLLHDVETPDIISSHPFTQCSMHLQHGNIPMALTEWMETQLVCNFSCIHCIREILFVCKNKQNCIPQFILKQRYVQKSDSLSIHHRVNHICSKKNQSIHWTWLTSFSILWSSSRASTTRSLSLLSTTKMRPWVFWK